MEAGYDPDNLLDRMSARGTIEHYNDLLARREEELVPGLLGRRGGDVLDVGCGWHPARRIFPAPAWRLVCVDADPARASVAQEAGADEAITGHSGRLDGLPDESFDVVYYRLVLHHVAWKESLEPTLAEAARLLRPGGVAIALEPNLWHPVGGALAVANRLGLGPRVHGTPDDVPLSPRRLMREARRAGLRPQLHALSFAWRRLPPSAQRALSRLDGLGSLRGLRALGHTMALVARRP